MRWLLIIALFLMTAVQAGASERIALLIGNSRYENADPLRNPENDVVVVEQSLKAVDFETIVITNVGLDAFKAALDDFATRLVSHKGATVLVYFAGHGIQRNGRNYLLPIDVDVEDEERLSATALAVDDLLKRLDAADTALQIVVLDACRDDPFAKTSRGAASMQRGLAAERDHSGQIVAFSTAPGRKALDGDSGTSPYASAFAEAVLVPGLTLAQTFNRVRKSVSDRTKGEQVPWENAALYADFRFVPSTQEAEISEVEALLWENAALLDNAEVYQRYIDRFPAGRFATLARQKIENINKDFSFRARSETFAVLSAADGKLNFCSEALKQGQQDAIWSLAPLQDYEGSLVYVELDIPLLNILCDKSEYVDVLAISGDRENCQQIIGTFMDGREASLTEIQCFDQVPDELIFADGGTAGLINQHGGMIVIRPGDYQLAIPALDAGYFSYLFDEAEGMLEYARIDVSGLVRIATALEEIELSIDLIPEDPARRGLTWKFQNTLEAYRGEAEATGLQVIELSREADKIVAEIAQEEANGLTMQSRWSQGESELGLMVHGDRAELVYLFISEDTHASGAGEDAHLFDGKASGPGAYAGTAYSFGRGCDPLEYDARAGLDESGRKLVVSGKRPILNERCRVVDLVQDTITLDFLDRGDLAAGDDN